MLHFETSYMKQNKSHKETLENAQDGLEIIFKFYQVTTSAPVSLILWRKARKFPWR